MKYKIIFYIFLKEAFLGLKTNQDKKVNNMEFMVYIYMHVNR